MENQPAISSDLIRGHIDTIILHTLTESDKFAQQISDAVESNSDNEYKINQATLYSSLKRLESLKLVSSYWHDYNGGRRKFFKITDLGKKTVEGNLSSWIYSRSIIDKLMNVAQLPASAPVFTAEKLNTETVTTKPEKTVYEINKNVNSDTIKAEDKTETKNSEIFAEKTEKSEKYEEHERNFRSILDGLIKLSAEPKAEERENISLEPIVSVSGENAKPDVQKFNETIDETDYNANRSNFNGKIDYGDLTLKAEKEGYNLRVSSKDSAKPVGNVLINKLNFAVSSIIFAICLIEIGTLYFALTSAFNSIAVIILSGVSVIQFIAFGAVYLLQKQKLSVRKISADSILIAAIVAFNLILINFAFDFLLEIDFSDTATLLATLVIPVIYYLDAVLFCVLRFLFYPRKAFSYK